MVIFGELFGFEKLVYPGGFDYIILLCIYVSMNLVKDVE